MEARFEVIGKEKAEEYIKANINNYRSIRKRKVDIYAAEMAAGKWQANGEPIVFDENGKLINGQHRLLAIIKSGVAVTILVVRGISQKVDIFDMGFNRTLTDIWSNRMDAPAYASQILAIASNFLSSFNTKYCTPKSDVLDYAEKHYEKLLSAARIATKNGPLRKAPCMVAAYVHLTLDENMLDKIAMFFQIANSGYPEDGIESTPPLLVRNYINKGYNTTSSVGRRNLYIITYLALADFFKGKKRTIIYKLDNEMPMKKMAFVKALDQIEDASKK